MALVATALLSNAFLLWALYRCLARSSSQADGVERPLSAMIGSLRSTLQHISIASGRAAEVSASARQRVGALSDDLDLAQNWFRYGLAKMDFEMDRISKGIQEATDKVQLTVAKPLSRAGSIAQGLRTVLELVAVYPRDEKAP